MVSIPENQLTDGQRANLQDQEAKSTIENVHGWVGLGKEVGEAVNTSLMAITTQADNFSKTGVGKLTVILVVWKVIGDQAIHIVGATVELLVFLPIFLWSYRKSCMTRAIVTSRDGLFGKKTWEVKNYRDTLISTVSFTPRHGHSLVLVIFTIIWLITLFSY